MLYTEDVSIQTEAAVVTVDSYPPQHTLRLGLSSFIKKCLISILFLICFTAFNKYVGWYKVDSDPPLAFTNDFITLMNNDINNGIPKPLSNSFHKQTREADNL